MTNYSPNKVVNILFSWQTEITDVLSVIILSCNPNRHHPTA